MYTPNVGRGHDPAEQVKMIEWYDGSNKPIHVILSEHSESKDLRTDLSTQSNWCVGGVMTPPYGNVSIAEYQKKFHNL